MKRVLIVYASKTGTAQDVAAELAGKLPNAQLYDCAHATLDGLKMRKEPSLGDYDIVVLGTAMYVGAPMKAFKKFVARHQATLGDMPTAFFTCGVGTEQEDKQYLLKSLPAQLKSGNLIYRHMGGEVRPEKMSGFARLAMKEYEKQHGQAPGINRDGIDTLAKEIGTLLEGEAS